MTRPHNASGRPRPGDQEQGTSLFKVTITVDADKVFHLTADDRAPWDRRRPCRTAARIPRRSWARHLPDDNALVESAGTYDIVVRW